MLCLDPPLFYSLSSLLFSYLVCCFLAKVSLSSVSDEAGTLVERSDCYLEGRDFFTSSLSSTEGFLEALSFLTISFS